MVLFIFNIFVQHLSDSAQFMLRFTVIQPASCLHLVVTITEYNRAPPYSQTYIKQLHIAAVYLILIIVNAWKTKSDSYFHESKRFCSLTFNYNLLNSLLHKTVQ